MVERERERESSRTRARRPRLFFSENTLHRVPNIGESMEPLERPSERYSRVSHETQHIETVPSGPRDGDRERRVVFRSLDLSAQEMIVAVFLCSRGCVFWRRRRKGPGRPLRSAAYLACMQPRFILFHLKERKTRRRRATDPRTREPRPTAPTRAPTRPAPNDTVCRYVCFSFLTLLSKWVLQSPTFGHDRASSVKNRDDASFELSNGEKVPQS